MNYKSFDNQNLLERFHGDEEILFDMITSFQRNFNELLDPLRTSIEEKNAQQLRLNAHTFKGILSTFHAEESKRIAFLLEERGKNSAFEDAHKLLNDLENHLLLFIFELNFFKKNLNKSI